MAGGVCTNDQSKLTTVLPYLSIQSRHCLVFFPTPIYCMACVHCICMCIHTFRLLVALCVSDRRRRGPVSDGRGRALWRDERRQGPVSEWRKGRSPVGEWQKEAGPEYTRDHLHAFQYKLNARKTTSCLGIQRTACNVTSNCQTSLSCCFHSYVRTYASPS